MIAIRPLLRAQTSLSATRTVRSAFVALSTIFALAACFSETGVFDPLEGVVPSDPAVVASLRVSNLRGPLTVLGSTTTLLVRAGDPSGKTLCAARYLGCASTLLTDRVQWKMHDPGVVSLEVAVGNILHGAAYVTALTPGRAHVTVSVQGVEATTFVDVVEKARVAWSLPITSAIAGSAVGEDGTIYIAGYAGLQAIGPEGALRWTLAERARAGLAIADDGTLYLGGSTGLMAIDPDGRVLWTAPIDRIWSPPAIGPDGTIYQNTSGGTLHAVDRAGRIKWRFEAPGAMSRNPSSPAVALDGTIYFASEDHHLYALDPDGSERWRIGTPGPVRAPSIGVDGTIYFASDQILAWGGGDNHTTISDAWLFAVGPDGSDRWSVRLDEYSPIWTGPAIGFDGEVYLGTQNGRTYVFAPDGSLLRKVSISAAGTPIVAGDGSLFYNVTLAADGHVVAHGNASAFDGDGTPRWDFRPGIPPRDTYILRAFEELGRNNGGYEAAPWPQARGDRANTGRAKGHS
jgi:outer membrane protein assembly factor BamB